MGVGPFSFSLEMGCLVAQAGHAAEDDLDRLIFLCPMLDITPTLHDTGTGGGTQGV